MEKDFEVWCDEEMVAGCSGLEAQAWAEALRYAYQYAQDGEVSIYEVTRKKIEHPDPRWWDIPNRLMAAALGTTDLKSP